MSKIGTDIDVTTTFKPMPKRFMVWDEKKNEFVKSVNTFDYYISSYLNAETTGIMDFIDSPEFVLVQSTNSYDKNGKEIFEGSIIRFDNKTYVIMMEYGCFTLRNNNDWGRYDLSSSHLCDKVTDDNLTRVEVIGHILSNSDLLED